jgi:hypothetical protein
MKFVQKIHIHEWNSSPSGLKTEIYDFQLLFSSILCPAEKVLSNTFPET